MKQKIVNLSQDGHSACEIAKILSMNRRTVAKIIKRYRERGSIENLPQSGRKKKTNIRTDRLLFRMVQNNRRQTLGDLTARFNNSTPYTISKRTVQRRLHGAGFKW